MSPQIGIDLGTTNSVVAYVVGNRAETIPNAEGHKTTPSVVLLREEDLVVGELAKRQAVAQPRNTVRSVKRLMGRRYSEIRDQLSEFPFEIKEGADDKPLIKLGRMLVTPEEISAAILTKMRMTAQDYLGEDIDQAVITVPAHFNDSQRTATKRAAEMAGLEVPRIINEPTAAALAYGIDNQKDERIAVFDFGGGTFDISVLQLSKGIFEVLATNGDTQLGGDNLDQIIMEWIFTGIQEDTGCDPRNDVQALQRIRETAEKVKCELSSLTTTTVSLPFVVSDESGPKHFSRELSRDEFLNRARPVLDRLIPPCKQVLRDSGLKPEELDRVLLVGGSTRIPEVRRIVQDVFKRDPSNAVNPDEAVAIGAAIQSGIITGSLQEVLLLDVVPLSLGIELAGGVFKALISRNSSIPTTVNRRFTTVVDNQQSVMVHVLQGERKMAKENRTLARFRLTGISPAPREVPEVDVRFHIDANGILHVSAQDLTSGTAQSVSVESYSSSVPSEDEVQRVVQDAVAHSHEDQAFLAEAQQKERMHRLQHQMEQFLEIIEGITESDIKAIKEMMIRLDIAARAREWGETDTAELHFKMIRGKYATDEKFQRAMSRRTRSGEEEMGLVAPMPPQAKSDDSHTGTDSSLEEPEAAQSPVAEEQEEEEPPTPGLADMDTAVEKIQAAEREEEPEEEEEITANLAPEGVPSEETGPHRIPVELPVKTDEDPFSSTSQGDEGQKTAPPQTGKKFSPPSWLFPGPGKPPDKKRQK